MEEDITPGYITMAKNIENLKKKMETGPVYDPNKDHQLEGVQLESENNFIRKY